MQFFNEKKFNAKNVVLCEPKTINIKGDDGKIIGSCQKIDIKGINENGTIGDYFIVTPEVFSFGINETVNPKKNLIDGHNISLCLWDKDKTKGIYSPNKEQSEFTTFLNLLGHHLSECVKELHTEKKLLPFYSKHKSIDAMINTTPFYWGKDIYEPIETGEYNDNGEKTYKNCPMLYVKLLENRRLNKVLTRFFDHNDNQIDFSEILNTRKNSNLLKVRCAIKIEKIFVSNTGIKLQMKVFETQCKIVNLIKKRLLLPKRQTEEEDEDYLLHETASIDSRGSF